MGPKLDKNRYKSGTKSEAFRKKVWGRVETDLGRLKKRHEAKLGRPGGMCGAGGEDYRRGTETNLARTSGQERRRMQNLANLEPSSSTPAPFGGGGLFKALPRIPLGLAFGVYVCACVCWEHVGGKGMHTDASLQGHTIWIRLWSCNGLL